MGQIAISHVALVRLARSTHALNRTNHFTTKLDLCLDVVAIEPRDNGRGPLRNTFVLCCHNALLHPKVTRKLIVCLVEMGIRSEADVTQFARDSGTDARP
jgi:hypothetical protein